MKFFKYLVIINNLNREDLPSSIAAYMKGAHDDDSGPDSSTWDKLNKQRVLR